MAAVIAKGDALISINILETEAKLIFTPDPDGLGWDADAINKLAQENKLSPPVDPKILESFLSKAARTKIREPMEMVLCEGIPSEEPVPETITWEELPIPSDLIQFENEARSVPPEIYRVKVERIKNEKIVKKSGALPFMPHKEETIVSWDKKETREKAVIDPEVKELKYAEKGEKIGTINPPVPGRPGKNVYGRIIPPPTSSIEGPLLGKGIFRQKNDLVTQASGFIRIGNNWVDLVPLAKAVWEIVIGLDGITPFLNFIPGDPRLPLPKAEEILQTAIDRGAYQSALISAKALNKEIEDAAKANINLDVFPLMESKEAKAEVIINADKTTAILYLRKATLGYESLDMRTISQAIKNSAVRVTDVDKLKEDIQNFMNSNSLELRDYILVEGKPSVRGKDREIDLLIELLSEEEQAPFLSRLKIRFSRFNEDEMVSIDELTGLAIVEKGQRIAQIGSYSEGEEGLDVFGNEIPGLPGNDPDLRLLGGIEQHGENIVAGKKGLLLISANERSFKAEIINYSNANAAINISADKMEVRVDMFKESGVGMPLISDWVLRELKSQGVIKGVSRNAVETACNEARIKGSCMNVVLARGKQPVAQGGRAVKWLVNVNPSTSAGEYDFEENSKRSVQVKADTIIAELSAVEEAGRPGYNVLGEEIPVHHASQMEIEFDDSIREEAVSEEPEDGRKRLVAVNPGELKFDGSFLSIISLLEINEDVGPSTGNINFAGEVKINGNVLPGSTVVGGLQVHVTGIVEEAIVSSGARALITEGIRGGGKGIVRARTNIESEFTEKATLMAVGDIRLNTGSEFSVIKTNGRLLVLGSNGSIFGGVCQAKNGLSVSNLGNTTGSHTEISFGQDYLIKDQINETENKIYKAKTALAGIDDIINEGIEDTQALQKTRTEKVRLMKILEKLKRKAFFLEEKFEEHHESEVRIRGTVYPGVVLESHGRYFEITKTRKGVIFYFDRESGRIGEKPLAVK